MIDKHTVLLIVNELESVRHITSSQLRSIGANNVLTANNGDKALRILQNQRVDIVLSGWNMPDMTGLELLKAVRADEKLSRLPFIMIVYEAERQRIKEAIANGVSDLLVNPYTASHLAVRVEKALALRTRSNSPVRAAQAPKSGIQAEPRVVKPIAHAVREPVRPTILIVDDIADNLMLLSDLFKDEYRVRIAQAAEKALAICQSDNPPDLVLLDIMMPGMDGFEMARRMREHPLSENIPVIFVTAMTGDDIRLKGLELGAVDFVTKPIDPDMLKPRVRNFMRHVELHKQLQAEYDAMLALERLREHLELISLDDMKGPLGTTILSVVRDYIAHLEGSTTGSVSSAISRLMIESGYDPEIVDIFDKEHQDEAGVERFAFKKSWINSKLLNESKNITEAPPVLGISLAQLKPGMDIASVYFDNKPYLKNCIADPKLISNICELKANTGSDPVINIRKPSQ
ncbi:MAG: response regulator [Methylococcaceae bacterium]